MGKIVGRTKEDLATLPRWASDRIKRLEQEVEHLQSLLAVTPPEKTNVTIIDYVDNVERGLSPNARVRFRIGRTQIEVGIPYKGDGTMLDVRSLDGRLVVEPQVSNVIGIRVQR